MDPPVGMELILDRMCLSSLHLLRSLRHAETIRFLLSYWHSVQRALWSTCIWHSANGECLAQRQALNGH
jgi:hypothetical protein